MNVFRDTTLIPMIIIFAVIVIVIWKELMVGPLEFLRGELRSSGRMKAVRLRSGSFITRFRTRVLLQNLPCNDDGGVRVASDMPAARVSGVRRGVRSDDEFPHGMAHVLHRAGRLRKDRDHRNDKLPPRPYAADAEDQKSPDRPRCGQES